MVRLLGHRQTKGAATDKPDLTPPRHISTLPLAAAGIRVLMCIRTTASGESGHSNLDCRKARAVRPLYSR